MTRFWHWWVARSEREMDSRILAFLRISVPLVVIIDLLRLAWLGLVPFIFRTYDEGGLSRFQDEALFIESLSPQWAGPVAWLVALVFMGVIASGRWMRSAIVIGALAYAQLGHLYPPGDRGIDRILRTVLLILFFSQANRRWSMDPRPALSRIPAWPVDLIRWMLVLVYLGAGVSKLMQQPRWLATSGTPVLYRILCDPMAARVDAVWAASFFGLWRVLGWVTVLFEISAFLAFTRWARYWALVGLGMHIGILLTMKLGIFGLGMLILYPVFFVPWVIQFLDRHGEKPSQPSMGEG